MKYKYALYTYSYIILYAYIKCAYTCAEGVALKVMPRISLIDSTCILNAIFLHLKFNNI